MVKITMMHFNGWKTDIFIIYRVSVIQNSVFLDIFCLDN